MRMVTVRRGSRPFLLRTQLRLKCTVFALVAATDAFAQDRVILFDPFLRSDTGTLLPGEIREIQITQGGRAWSLVRSVPLPPHTARPAVALADGSRILWLAGAGNSMLLVQYDATTARASIIDIGVFDRGAFLVSDPLTPRVYVVEPQRVTFLDYRLRPTTVALSGTKGIIYAQATGSHLIVHRRGPGPDDVVVVDTNTTAVINTLQLGGLGSARASRNGRLYAYFPTPDRIEALTLTTGTLISRTLGTVTTLFEFEDSRGVLVHEGNDPRSGLAGTLVRDAGSLAVIGEFAPGMYDNSRDLSLSQTAGGTILMYSREIMPSYLDSCRHSAPRIDIFDGRTFASVNRIGLNGRCTQVVPLPSPSSN